MKTLRSNSSAFKVEPPKLRCQCPGCRAHIAILERFNRELSTLTGQQRRENDDLRRQLDGQVAA
jgi:hypothetical protein